MPDKIYRLIFQKDDGTEESVEFTAPQGPQGEQGPKGDKGDKGDTGETGAAGKDGAAGQNGKDGVPATHSWNGTTLTVTSASGTSSANLKGEKGDQGDIGEQGPKGDQGIQGPKGDKGDTGATGATGPKPVKGTDYWTAADQEAIVQDVIAALGTPVFGRVDADKNIITTGDLADGTYTYWYENADGTVTEIGTVTVGEVMPESGEVELVWTQTKLDKTTGAEGTGDGYYASQHIELVDGYAYTASQVKDASSGNTTGAISICYYDANGGYLGYEELWASSGNEQSKVLTPKANSASFRVRLYCGLMIEARYHVTFEKAV